MNGEIKVAVCDDLEEDRQVLVNLLSEYTDKNNLYVKIQEFTSGEAFLASDTSEYSLVFMDIFMDGINGMETAKALIVRNSRVQIVFESTSTEFAAEAFDIEALHYLVKPVKKEKLFGILDRFFDSVYSLRTVNVKVGRLEESIYLSDILYVEADGKRAKVHTKKGVMEVSMSVAELEKRVLPPYPLGAGFHAGNCGNAYRCAEIIGSDRNSHQPFKAQGNTGNLCGLQLAKHQTPHAGKNRIIL